MHLVIDGYGGDYQNLCDPDFVHRFLDDYPNAIGMTKITPPHVHTYHGPTPQDWGISGFVIIAESHISVHTFPERRYVNIDVFSCKEFDPDKAEREIVQIFSLESVKRWVLERGLEHITPEEAQTAVQVGREQLQQQF